MRGISHRDRLGARGKDVAGKYRCQLVRFDSSSIDSQFFGEQFVELDQMRPCDWCWRKPREKMLRQARIAVGEDSDRSAVRSAAGAFSIESVNGMRCKSFWTHAIDSAALMGRHRKPRHQCRRRD
jgi:hypothetical protein